MKVHAMYAAISPRDSVVGLLSDQSGVVQVLNSAGIVIQSVSPEQYILRHPDTFVAQVRDEEHAIDLLAERSTKSICLDMTLLLFDRDVTPSTRQELAMELDQLLRDDENRDYVLDIVLCRAFPTLADVDGAVEAVRGHCIVQDVVASILRCQDRVGLISESWLVVKQEPIVQQAGPDRVFALFSRCGVFRQLALAATDTTQLDAIKSSLALAIDREQLDSAPRIIVILANELRKRLPPGTPRQRVPHAHVDADDVASEWRDDDFARPQHTSDYAAYNAALSQVDKIVVLYGQMRDAQARAMLDELAEEQIKYPTGERLFVKSLCNIAKQVNSHGRPEISFECLQRALSFPNGIDSQLYLQIGTGLRSLRKFDEAEKCLKLARQLDDGTLSDRIRLQMIRVTVARGSYEEACDEYLAIPDLQLKTAELCGLGTLYRRMGRPREARERYQDCLNLDAQYHPAYAGRAEIWKQNGKPHRAIAEYNALITRFTDLEVGSKKVYDLARSHLFRLTEQYEKSERILQDLANEFPGDRGVHLQLAKLLLLQGDHDQARDHFERARRPSLRDLSELVFAQACRVYDSVAIREELAGIQSSLMPEDKGLASCVEAYNLMAESDFDRAQHVLSNAIYVERLVGDLADVLRFHALRKTCSSFDYRSDRALCRVAKRSDRNLRWAMKSIANGDYSEADRLESEFLLRVAV